MGGIANLLNAILEVMGLHLEPGTASVGALIVFVLLLPWIWRSQRGDEAVRILKRASHERRVEREALESLALAKVAGNPNGLWLVANEALRQGRMQLARTAADQLRQTGKLFREWQLLMIQIEGELPKTPEEVAIRAERLLESGQVEQAEQLLSSGRQRWPQSPAWAEVERRRSEGTTENSATSPG